MLPTTMLVKRSACEFLRTLQESMFCDPLYGFDYADVDDDSPETHAICAAILTEAAYPNATQQVRGNGLNLFRNLRQIPNDIRDDLDPKIKQNRDLWDHTILGILPIGTVNGCALSTDRQGNPLDSYVIAINYGLVFGCDTLADALAIELLDGDLKDFADDGSVAFRYAIERFITPTADVFKRTQLIRSWPPAVEGCFAVRSGALMAIMLQFVVLHEFGHIVNGDAESSNGVRMMAIHDTPTVEYRRDSSAAMLNWPSEFAADRFAIEVLCDWNGNAPTCWPNVAQVYLFFAWLEQIEQTLGRPLCPFHPRPRDRKKGVLQRALEISPSGPREDYFHFIDDRVAAWTH